MKPGLPLRKQQIRKVAVKKYLVTNQYISQTDRESCLANAFSSDQQTLRKQQISKFWGTVPCSLSANVAQELRWKLGRQLQHQIAD
jgi:hypothetical protein